MRKAGALAIAVTLGMLPPFAADRTAFEILAAVAGTWISEVDPAPPVLIVALDMESDLHPDLAGLPRSQWPEKIDAPLSAFTGSGVAAVGLDLVWPLAGPDAPGWLALLRQLSRDGRIVLGYLHDGERIIAPHPAQVAAAGGRANLRPLNLPGNHGRIRRAPAMLGSPRQPGLAHELARRARGNTTRTDTGVLLRPWHVNAVQVTSLADLLDCGIPRADYRVALLGAWLPNADRYASVLRLQPPARRSVTRLRCGQPPRRTVVQDPAPGVLLHALGVQAFAAAVPLRRLPHPAEAMILAAAAGPFLFRKARIAAMSLPLVLVVISILALPRGWLLPWAGGLAASGTLLALAGMQAASRSLRAWRETLPATFRDQPKRRTTIEASVCFLDIEQWTQRGERAEAGVLARELAACLGTLDRIITAHGGYVDKYLGDGLMALFGMDEKPDHARRAVQAVCACIAACEGAGGPRIAGMPVRLRAGIASGPVQAGDLGIGARVHFTAIGDTVNVAARLEQMNRSQCTRILVNEALVRACPDIAWTPVGMLELRGRREAIAAWTL